jgi:serine/threonine protein phosphatase PrpC
VNGSTRTVSALRAAGDTDPGLQRDVNEDRFHVDVSRGLFTVVDGIGGQAAGGKAADIALTMLRTRLERETGPVVDRVREAITIANNEIHRVAGLRPEWNGMACVLTVAVMDDHQAIVGHVGDTRLYKIRDDRIEKVTHDHSPVGEREDAGEISELEAMHHPRRNEVYRDVGSEPHLSADPDFIDVHEIPFEPDAALLLCSDGLTDLIESASIGQVVRELAGQPHQVVKALIEAANTAGGKDNITVVYVEGEQFASHAAGASSRVTRRADGAAADRRSAAVANHMRDEVAPANATPSRRSVRIAVIALLALVTALALFRFRPSWLLLAWPEIASPISDTGTIVVRPTESIAAALRRAQAGSAVVVEPGEYRETVVLVDGVRLVSRVPRGATIRLPGTASERDAAVVAANVSGAAFVGFRILGDAATPLGTGLLVKDAEVSVVDVEITGAVNVAIDLQRGAPASHPPLGENRTSFGGGQASDLRDMARVSVVASDVHDNPGAALAIRSGASARIAHNVFIRNGVSERVSAALIIEEHAEPRFSGNVFHGIGPNLFGALDEAARIALMRDNWFADSQNPRSTTPTAPRGRRGR